MQTTFGLSTSPGDREEVHHSIRQIAPSTVIEDSGDAQVLYRLNEKDTNIVQQALKLLDQHQSSNRVVNYDIIGTTIEDVFLGLMSDKGKTSKAGANDLNVVMDNNGVMDSESENTSTHSNRPTLLASGRPVSVFHQALTIFYKRLLVLRRSWLPPLIALGIAIGGHLAGLSFIYSPSTSCSELGSASKLTMWYDPPISMEVITFDWLKWGGPEQFVTSPPDLLTSAGVDITGLNFSSIENLEEFSRYVRLNSQNLTYGGLAIDPDSLESLLVLQVFAGETYLSFSSNYIYNKAMIKSATGGNTSTMGRIQMSTGILTSGTIEVMGASTDSLPWAAFFGAAMVSSRFF